MAGTKFSCNTPDQCGNPGAIPSWSDFRTIQPSSSAARSHRRERDASVLSSTSCKPRLRNLTWSWGCCGRRWGWRRRRRGRGWWTEGESEWLRTCWARPPGSQSWFWKYFWAEEKMQLWREQLSWLLAEDNAAVAAVPARPSTLLWVSQWYFYLFKMAMNSVWTRYFGKKN